MSIHRLKPYGMCAPYVAAHLDADEGYRIIKNTPFKDTAWKISHRLYIPLPRLQGEDLFFLPDCLPRETIRLHLAERYRPDGGATIVCGLKGGRLRPYFLDNSPLPDYLTCWFSVTETAFTITAWSKKRTVLIKRRSLAIDGRSVSITEPPESRFECQFGDALPFEFNGLKDAVNAAITKSEYPVIRNSYFFNPCRNERVPTH